MKPQSNVNSETQSMDLIRCSVCGMEYDPLENPACVSCPLHRGCTMTCCPRCGSSNIHIQRSWVVGIAKKLISGGGRVSS